MALSSALRTLLRAPGANPLWLLSLALPGATQRYGHAPFASASQGMFRAKLLDLGIGGRAMSVGRDGGRLQAVEIGVSLVDSDHQFSKLLYGSSGDEVWGSTATLYLTAAEAVPTLAFANWHTEFSGRLVSGSHKALVWSLILRPNDLPLQGKIPQQRIAIADWPNADTAVLDKPAPLLYGKHSSLGISNTGALPTLYVDKVGYRYLLCLGAAKTVDRVYVDGVLITSGYSVTYPTVAGRLYTVLDFTADQGENAVTCDATGYDATGDTTGALITDPSDILKHLLVNFVFASHPGTGAWYSDSTAPVDTTSFATVKTFLSARSYACSPYIAEPTAAQSALESICTDHYFHPYWTSTGKIGVAVIDNGDVSIYQDTPWLDASRGHEIGESYSLSFRDIEKVKGIEVKHAYQAAPASYSQTLDVRDVSITSAGILTREQRSSPAYVVA